MPKLTVIQGGQVENPKYQLTSPRQQNAHMVTYYKATRTFEKFWEKLQKEAGR